MSEELLRNYLNQLFLFERRLMDQSTFKQQFLKTNTDFKSMNPGRKPGEKEIRLGLHDATIPLSSTAAITAVNKIPGFNVVDTIPPKGGAQSRSDKYETHIVQGPNDTFSVVFGSPNKGEVFEQQLHKQLRARMGPLADELLSALNLPATGIRGVEDLKPARRRPLTGEVNDVGSAISDITLDIGEAEPLYISLKDPTGSTFANAGYAGAFTQSGNVVTPASHGLDAFVTALGVDKSLVAQGITDYVNGAITKGAACKKKQSVTFDAAVVAKYLASGLGYGYVYARRHEDGYTIKLLETPQDAIDMVGTPTSVNVSYPRYCEGGKDASKQVTAVIETDSGAKFTVEIRGSKRGNVLPNEIKIKITKYPESSTQTVNWGRSQDHFDIGPYWDEEGTPLWAHFKRSGKTINEKMDHTKLLRYTIREMLLVEELSVADKKAIEAIAKKQATMAIKRDSLDKKEVEKLAKKQAEDAIKKALGKTFMGTKGDINKFVSDVTQDAAEEWLKDKVTQQQVADITKKVIKKLYRELAVSYPGLIDRIKV